MRVGGVRTDLKRVIDRGGKPIRCRVASIENLQTSGVGVGVVGGTKRTVGFKGVRTGFGVSTTLCVCPNNDRAGRIGVEMLICSLDVDMFSSNTSQHGNMPRFKASTTQSLNGGDVLSLPRRFVSSSTHQVQA